ncbi:phage repressor protein, partial [Streptococcus ictaluri]
MARGRGKLTPQEIEAMQFFSSKLNNLLNETNTKQV